MSSGFYDLLGLGRTASAGSIRAAYSQHVTNLSRRRRRLVEQGGDPTELDHQRALLDEAWGVLSDPRVRRRYDAMVVWSDTEDAPRQGPELWTWVAPRLTSPSAAAATKLLRATTKLSRLGELPLAPSASEGEPPTLVPHDEDHTSKIVALPTARGPAEVAKDSPLRVVEGKPGAPPVVMMPTDAGRMPTVSSEDLARLVDEHGYSGKLLQAVRRVRKLDLRSIAERTNISFEYLTALEAETFDVLPSSRTFVRGYVREYASELGLDEDQVADGYMRRFLS